jgi:hypothetical protein
MIDYISHITYPHKDITELDGKKDGGTPRSRRASLSGHET